MATLNHFLFSKEKIDQFRTRQVNGSHRLDVNSGSAVQCNQQSDRPISQGNESINQSVVYLDDASPVTCSTLFGKYTQSFTDLIPFNIKLAFIFYCVIPIFVYIKLGLNYLVKREFLVELTSKQQALLVGSTFAFLFDMKSFTSIATATFPLIMILFFLALRISPHRGMC